MSDVVRAFAVCLQAREPAIIWGPPGTGKTSMTRQIGGLIEDLNPVVVIEPSLRQNTDLLGWPYRSEGGLDYDPPRWFKDLVSAGRGLLMIDEASTMPPTMQAASMGIVLEGRAGDHLLPERVARVLASNDPEDTPGGSDLAPPLANRMAHLEWENPAEEWCNAMISGFKPPQVPILPDKWQAHIPYMVGLATGFIRKRPDFLHKMPDNPKQRGKAWPSHRSWHQLSRLLAASRAAKLGQDVDFLLATGCVGPIGGEFLSWQQEQDLPDIEELLKDPSQYKHPKRGDRVYAVLSAVAAWAIQDGSVEMWTAAWEVMGRAAKKGAADVAVAAAAILGKPDNIPEGATVPDIVEEFIPIYKEAGLM